LVDLQLDASRPDSFPNDERFWRNRYREHWIDRMSYADDLISGRVQLRPCPAPPIAWGGTMDDHIALRRGLVRIDCGDTENRFWGRPNRVPERFRADRLRVEGPEEDASDELRTGESQVPRAQEGVQRGAVPPA
jgi:hypothetical protein